MPYTPTVWKNREVERPRTFTLQNNTDGTVTLIPSEGNIIEAGTPIIADNMNKIEQGIVEAMDAAESAESTANGVASVLTSHLEESATDAHLAKNIRIEDTEGNFTATNVEDALKEVFTNVSNGKIEIATAITGKGVTASGSETFSSLANKIEQIEIGDYKIGDYITSSKLEKIFGDIWNFDAGNAFYSVTIDNNGYVYGGCIDGSIYKISPSGSQVWAYSFGSSASHALITDQQNFIYSGSFDNTVRKIDQNGSEIWSFTGHTSYVYGLVVDSHGNIYSGSRDNTVRKIDQNGSEIWSFTGHAGYVSALTIDQQDYVYSGGSDNKIIKIDSDGSEVRRYYTSHSDTITALAVNTQNFIYSGSVDSTVRKIDQNGSEIWSFTGHTDTVYAIALDQQDYVYSGGGDNKIIKIDSDGSEIWSFTEPVNSIRSLVTDPQGHIYSASFDHKIRKTFDGIKIIL